MVWCIVAFVAGIVLGGLSMGAVITHMYKQYRVGKLRIDRSTGDPYLFMQLNVPVEFVLSQKEIVLEVDLNDLTRDLQ
jgi:hypothetical protein